MVDAVGELGALYAIAQAAFVGGSLVPVGGHNVLEPAALGVPVLFGPHTDHVSGPAESLVAAGGARRVRDARELASAWIALIGDAGHRERMAGRAAAVIESSRGALERSVKLIFSALDGTPASRAG